jgi:serine/threonine protein kinase
MPLKDLGRLEGKVFAQSFQMGRCLAKSGEIALFDAVEISTHRALTMELTRSDEGSDEAFVDAPLLRVLHSRLLRLETAGVTSDGISYAAMEKARGEPLATRLDRDQRVPVLEAVEIAVGIAEIVDAIHVQGAVHAGLHPLRVFGSGDARHIWLSPGLRRGSRIDLLSDEWVRNLSAERSSVPWRNAALAIYSPVEYCAPEILLGSAPDPKTDVYALGALLYEMLVGSPPYRHPNTPRVAAGHLALHPMPMGTDVHPRIQIEVIRALAKKADQRPATMAQFAESLQRAIATPSAPPRQKHVHADVTTRVTVPDDGSWPDEEMPTLRVGGARIVRSRASDSLITVWETTDGNLVVQLSADFASNPRICKAFVGEAELLAGLDHPSIARVLESVAEGETAYVVLAAERGVSLRDLLSAGLTPSVAQRIGLEVAEALHSVHERGARLGDLTPETILITDKGRIVLLPTCVAGISRLADKSEPRRSYMGPELDGGTVHTGSDVYALAAILSEALGGAPAPRDTARTRALTQPAPTRPSAADLSSELRQSGEIAPPEDLARLVRRFCEGVLADTDLGKRPSLPAPSPPPAPAPAPGRDAEITKPVRVVASRTKTSPMPAPVLNAAPPPARAKVDTLVSGKTPSPATEATLAPSTKTTPAAPYRLDRSSARRRRATWIVLGMITSAAGFLALALASRRPPDEGKPVELQRAATQPPPIAAPAQPPARASEAPKAATTAAPPAVTPRQRPTRRRAERPDYGIDDLKPIPE